MKKIIAVLLTVCLIFTASVCIVSAYTAKEDEATTKASSSSALGDVLDGVLGDTDLSSVTDLLDGFDLSSIIGDDSDSPLNDILDAFGNVETTTENVPATRPADVTEKAAAEETTKKKSDDSKKKESTTAQAVQNYYYYYVNSTTDVATTVTETTTVTYEYIPPETIYTDLLTTAYAGQEDAVDTSDGFGIKTVIGIIILIGSGAAVVFLCVRKRASY